MKNRIFRTVIIMLTAAATIMGCTMPDEAAPTQAPIQVQASPAPTSIQHTTIPAGLPEERTNHAGDHDSSKSAAHQEAPGGDRFSFGQYERPFIANTMDVYFPYLDIVDTFTYEDETWVFATIRLYGGDANGLLAGNYAVEIDSDINGKGDWLVLVSKPGSTEWSTEGVQVWQDSNQDNGGINAVFADEDLSSGDGFDFKVFDGGQSQDPDAAWARVSPTSPTTVEIAVKRSLVDDDGKYLAGMWAGNDSLNPAMFDFNDHMTHEQAGAALRGLEIFYPIKGLAELDASCRVSIGFEPTGLEPGLCETLIINQSEEGCKLNDSICASKGPGFYFDAPSCTCKYFG